LSNTPDRDGEVTKFVITHPFHPLYNHEFELVDYRHNWGEDRVYFYDFGRKLLSVPAYWTSIVLEDPFVKISKGRSFFRVEDLFRLYNLIQNLKRKSDQVAKIKE
jgi:hypothetical protein